MKLNYIKKVYPRKCLNCKEKFIPVNQTNTVCSTKCAIEYSKAMQKKKSEKEWKAEKAVLKDKTKTISDWKKDLQKEINAIVREIDKGHPCIATGTMEGKRNAGHYISIGSNDTLRFHLENIWNQSEHSNTWKSGDTLRYQEGIVKLYGKEYLDRLNALKSISPIKLTSEEISYKISIARGIIKWLKLQNRIFTTDERLELRIRFNKELGIY